MALGNKSQTFKKKEKEKIKVEELINKIGFLLMPNNFKTIFPYCFWYWLVLTGLFYWVIKKK